MLQQTMMQELTRSMEHQFIANTRKNIFCTTNQLSFHKHTMKVLPELRKQVCLCSKEQVTSMTDAYQTRFLNQFYQVNQYAV